MSAITTTNQTPPALQMSESELIEVLSTSLYPGATISSIKMVLSYCKASGLDPMQKPVHIVPMWDSKSKQMRDVVMPGIGLYRTQAARSNAYGGITEPIFGEDVTDTLSGVAITYPQWCKVTVKRKLPDGTFAEFTAVERWRENYATAGRDTQAPNAMWKKRPYGQLAKCAQAQALRMAFPEIGAEATAEEMEGKALFDGTTIDNATGEIVEKKKELPAYPDDKLNENLAAWQTAIDAGKSSADRVIAMVSSKYKLSDEQREKILSLKKTEEVTQGDIKK